VVIKHLLADHYRAASYHLLDLELLTGYSLAKMRLNTLLARGRAVDGQTGLPLKR